MVRIGCFTLSLKVFGHDAILNGTPLFVFETITKSSFIQLAKPQEFKYHIEDEANMNQIKHIENLKSISLSCSDNQSSHVPLLCPSRARFQLGKTHRIGRLWKTQLWFCNTKHNNGKNQGWKMLRTAWGSKPR